MTMRELAMRELAMREVGYEIDIHVNYNIVDREMYGTYNIKKSYERDDYERVGYERSWL